MTKNYLVYFVLLLGIASCKPKEPITPVTEYIEFKVNNGNTTRYEIKGIPPNYSIVSALRYSPLMPIIIISGADVINNLTNNIILVINNGTTGQPLTTIAYPTNESAQVMGTFVDTKIVGGDTIQYEYSGEATSVGGLNQIKIDEMAWDSLGVVKGSFYFENVEQRKTINSGASQVISTNNKVEGTFRVKFSK